MNIATFAEVASIGMVLPFLAVLTEPDLVYGYHYVKNLRKVLN